MQEITTENLQLMLNIVVALVIPSVLWIVRYPLRALVKWLFKLLLGVELLESLISDFQIIETAWIQLEDKEDNYELVILKSDTGFYKYQIIDDEGVVFRKSICSYKTSHLMLKDIRIYVDGFIGYKGILNLDRC